MALAELFLPAGRFWPQVCCHLPTPRRVGALGTAAMVRAGWEQPAGGGLPRFHQGSLLASPGVFDAGRLWLSHPLNRMGQGMDRAWSHLVCGR